MTFSKNIFLTFDEPNKAKKVNLYCIPSAGCSASMYSGWIQDAPSYLAVYPIEYPGHGFRVNEALTPNPDDIALEIYQAILEKDDKPFVLFGHSIGTAILWRILELIQKNNQTNRILLLAISGRPETSFLRKEKNVYLLPEKAFLKKILYYSNIPEQILSQQKFLDFFIPIIRNDFEMNEKTYADKKIQTHIPLIAFSGMDDPDTDPISLNAWSSYSSNWLGSHFLPGKHFYINDKINYQKILIAIHQQLKDKI